MQKDIKAFLGCSFKKDDNWLKDFFKNYIESLGFQVDLYDFPDSHQLPEGIELRIEKCDCLVSILTKRHKLEGKDDYLCSSWIASELAIAKLLKKPIVVLVEEGVTLEGIAQLERSQEFIRESLTEAIPKINKYLLDIKQSLTSDSKEIDVKPIVPFKEFNIFPNLLDSRSTIYEIWHDFSKKQRMIVVKIIANTGMTILPMVNEYLSRYDKMPNLHFKMLLINPDLKIFDEVATHWREECLYVINTALPAFNRQWQDCGRIIKFDWKLYDYLPTVGGLLIDQSYLLVGFCEWCNVGKKRELRGAENPFLYFTAKDKYGDHFFRLFSSWFDYGWEQRP